MCMYVFELQSEMLMFILDAIPKLAEFFRNSKWLLKLVYLANTFAHLNELNLCMQDMIELFYQARIR